jgi:tetratricopeptide (TPR) repeat protein
MALEHSRIANGLCPNAQELKRNTVNILIELNRLDDAEQLLDDIGSLEPNEPMYWLRRMELHVSQRQYLRAVDWLSRIISKRPLANDYSSLGLIMLGLGHFDVAERVYRLWLSFNPSELDYLDAASNVRRLAPPDLPSDVRARVEHLVEPPPKPRWWQALVQWRRSPEQSPRPADRSPPSALPAA